MNAIDQIKLLKTLTPNEEVLKQFIIENIDHLINIDINELEKKTYVSNSSIYRFCKKVGFKGYDDLRLSVAKDLLKNEQKGQINFNYPFTKNDSIDTVANNMSVLYQDSVAYTFKSLDYNELSKAVYYLNKSKDICFITSNMNTLLGEIFKARLKEIGKSVKVSKSTYEWKVDTLNLTSDDCVVICSYAGTYSKPILNILPYLHKNNVPVILIGSVYNESFFKHATCKLFICDKENPSDKIFGFSSSISTQYILDTIYSCLFQKEYEKNLEKHKYIYE